MWIFSGWVPLGSERLIVPPQLCAIGPPGGGRPISSEGPIVGWGGFSFSQATPILLFCTLIPFFFHFFFFGFILGSGLRLRRGLGSRFQQKVKAKWSPTFDLN